MALISSKVAEDKRVELEIKVEKDVFTPAVERAIKKRSSSIAMPGFRKGKAPRNLIIKTYGMGLFYEDAVNELYPSAYKDAVDASDIEPVDTADIEITDVNDDGFTFKAIVTVKPEVKLGTYKGIKVTKAVEVIDDAKVDGQIEATRERNARLVTVTDRAAEEGDTATIDFEGFVDGVGFEGGKGENYLLNLGSGTFIPGFEDQVIGKNLEEEFDVNVTFPEEYGVESLNGKEAVFKVVIHELKQKELPELDDEFAKDVSEFDTLAEYRADIKAKLEASAEQNADANVENSIMKEISETMETEVPQAMIESRIDDLVRDFGYRLQMQGLNMEQFLTYTGNDMKAFRDTFVEQAKQQVLVRLALEAIVKEENIEITEEELEAEYIRLSEQHKLEIDKLKGLVSEKDLKSDLACNKALDLVKSSAEVTIGVASDETDESEKSDSEEKPEKKTAKKTTVKKAAKEEGAEAPKKRATKAKAEAEKE